MGTKRKRNQHLITFAMLQKNYEDYLNLKKIFDLTLTKDEVAFKQKIQEVLKLKQKKRQKEAEEQQQTVEKEKRKKAKERKEKRLSSE